MAYIATIYRVSIEVPYETWDWIFRYDMEHQFEREISVAREGHAAAGRNSYAEVEEWAEFSTYAQAELAAKRMDMVVTKYVEAAR